MKSLTPNCVKRSNRRDAEMAVGLARHAGEVVVGNGVTDERADDLDGDFRIGPAGKAAIVVRVELRQAAARRGRRRGASPANVASAKPSGGASPLVDT
jgi:hypothetical protein